MGKKMRLIDNEISSLDAEIARLQGKREGLAQAKQLLTHGGHEPNEDPDDAPVRKRSPNVKPTILDIMIAAGASGATSAEVSARVKEAVPTVAKDTVGSVLSRLKADSALAFDGERYYESRFAPKKKLEQTNKLATSYSQLSDPVGNKG